MNASVSSSAASLADLNGDGIPDLAYGGDEGQFVVAFGLGNGSFQSEQVFSAASTIRFMIIIPCDLNEDGMVDLVLVERFGTRYIVMLNSGNGTFWNALYSPSLFFRHILDIKIGCLNDDNHLDMAIIYINEKIMNIHFGFGNVSFAEALTVDIPGDSYPSTLEMKDFNGDHRLDLFIAFHSTDEFVVVLNDC